MKFLTVVTSVITVLYVFRKIHFEHMRQYTSGRTYFKIQIYLLLIKEIGAFY